MLRQRHPARHRSLAVGPVLWRLCASLCCTLAVAACRDSLGPGNAAPEDAGAPSATTGAGPSAEPGIGGAFFMAASGDAITPVDLQATGITIPAGTQVQVEVSGSITRTHTPGLVQFCALAHMQRNCQGAWAEILRETPFSPSDGSGPRAMVSWDGGEPAFPDSGSGTALAGPAGGELWAGRNGLQCWYVDHVTGIRGACFSFGGGYHVTVRPQPEAVIGGGGGDPVHARLGLSVLRSTIGPAGGSAYAEVHVETTPETADEPPVGFTQWYFVPDSMRTETGTPVPSPFDLRADAATRDVPSAPQRVDAERFRLPDGRIVGSGIHLVDPAAVARGPSAAQARSAPAPTTHLATGTTTTYPECDAAPSCFLQFGTASGTIVVSTRLAGVPVSASARLGVQGGESDGRVEIVRVVGPNPGGSFTTRENSIALEATATPGHAGSVEWEFVDDQEDHVESPHVVVGSGAEAVATIGTSRGGRARWPAGHPGRLDQKAFRYVVRAHATYGGRRVYSEPVVLTQHVIDVIRQEFIDYDTPLALTPPPGAFMQVRPTYAGIYQYGPTAETGLGDYCVTGGTSCTTLVSDRLAPFLVWLQGVWRQPSLVATSIFRNPVHHHGHSPAARNNSPHKYGTAVDYDVVGADKSVQQKLHWTALRNTGLLYPQGGICAETWYLGNTWAGNHVHFDRRLPLQSPCLDTWRIPESITTQQSSASLDGAAHDSLVVMVRSDDFDVRFAAASALAELPSRELPAGYAAAALSQLEEEIARRRAGVPVQSEEYGAYLLELARVVHRGGEPAAAPILAQLGIDVSRGIRRFVARHAQRSIPALEAAWQSEEALQADVIGTYAEMLRFQSDSGWHLAPAEAMVVDRAFLRAAVGGVIGQWGVAFSVGRLGLTEYVPLLTYLATLAPAADDPSGLVAAATAEALVALQPALAAAGPADLLQAFSRLHRSTCGDAAGQRLGQCTAMEAQLAHAVRAIDGGEGAKAADALRTYRHLLQGAAERGIFSQLEHRLLDANALTIIGKVN